MMQRRRIEHRLQPEKQRQQRSARKSKRMKDRQRVEENPIGFAFDMQTALLDIRQQIPLAQDDALRRPCRSRRDRITARSFGFDAAWRWNGICAATAAQPFSSQEIDSRTASSFTTAHASSRSSADPKARSFEKPLRCRRSLDAGESACFANGLAACAIVEHDGRAARPPGAQRR